MMEALLNVRPKVRMAAVFVFLFFVMSVAIILIPALVQRSLDEYAMRRIDKTFDERVQAQVAVLLEAEIAVREISEAIVLDWSAEDWKTYPDGKVTAEIFGRKSRGDCKFIRDFDVAGLATVNGVKREIVVKFLDDPVAGNTRPLGDQSFGVWGFFPPEGLRIDAGGILVLTAHDCGGEVAEVPGTGPFTYPGNHPTTGE